MNEKPIPKVKDIALGAYAIFGVIVAVVGAYQITKLGVDWIRGKISG